MLATPIKSLSKISGEDPTMVMVPPKIAQNPIGISKRDIGRSVRTEIRLTTGKNSAAAPTFCMNEEMIPTDPEIIGMILASVAPPSLRIKPATLDIKPVLSSPAPIIMTAIMEMTALDAKPSNSRDVSAKLLKPGTWLSRPKATIVKIAVKSIRNNSVIKRVTVTPKIAKTTIISDVNKTRSIITLLTLSKVQSITSKFHMPSGQAVYFRINSDPIIAFGKTVEIQGI